MGIIAQAAFVGRQSVTPSRNLYTGIPLVQFLFFRSISEAAGTSDPGSNLKFRTRCQQFVLQQDQTQETVGSILIQLFVASGKSGLNNLLRKTSFLGDRLADDIDQIILEIIVSLELIGYRHHHGGSTNHIVRIIIVFHLRPA